MAYLEPADPSLARLEGGVRNGTDRGFRVPRRALRSRPTCGGPRIWGMRNDPLY